MLHARIIGMGSYVPDRVVPNDEIPFLNERHERCAKQQTEADDAWIRELTGVEARRYVPEDTPMGPGSIGSHIGVAVIPAEHQGVRIKQRKRR